jgi:hypothetical protein
MTIKNKVTGGIPNISTYDADGVIVDITLPGNVTAANLVGDHLTLSGNAVIAGNATILGNLTYNDINNITTSNLVIGLGNTQTGVLVSGGGMVVGNTAEASFTYNYATQAWDSNIGLSAVGNVSGANIVTGGSVVAVGGIAGESLAVSANITASGNISGAYIIGNGSQLTGLPESYANSDVANYLASNANVVITTTGNVTTTANIAAEYFIGDGSQLTGLPAGYANADVATYLASNANVVITTTGNITTTANISGDYIIGNGSQLTGLPPGYANSDVADYLASNANVVITTTGNISGDYIIGNGSQLTGMYSNTEVAAYLPTYTGNLGNVNSITASGNVTVTGNLTAANIGNVAGANFTGVVTQWLAGNGTWQTPPVSTLRNITKVDQAYGYGTAFIIADGRLFIAKGNGTNNAFCSALDNQSVALQAGINNMYELPFVEEDPGTIVDAGQYGPSAYALFSNGNLYTWGYNGYGQLGIGSTTDRFLPVLSNSNVAQVYVTKAQNSTYGIQRIVIRKTNNTYFGCGHDGQYQFGLGTNTNKTSWTALPWIPATALSVWVLGGDLGNIFVQEADGQIRVTG